jgi:hypothetical protein
MKQQRQRTPRMMRLLAAEGVALNVPWPGRKITNKERQAVTEELGKLEPHASSPKTLLVALHYSAKYRALLPTWAFRAMDALIKGEITRDRRSLGKLQQDFIDEIRWATVTHLRASRHLTWLKARSEAVLMLRQTPAAGSEETMKKACRKTISKLSSKLKERPDDLGEHAKMMFENRESFLANSHIVVTPCW